VETVYEPAFNVIMDYIRRFGIFHHVLNARMLWDDNATVVHPFDFGDDTERDPKAADDPDVVRTRVCAPTPRLTDLMSFTEKRSCTQRIHRVDEQRNIVSGLVCQRPRAIIGDAAPLHTHFPRRARFP